MRAVVYITKNKIWAGEQVFDWDSVSLDEVFGRIKKELKVNYVRVVLGNDLSFVTAVKAGDTFLNRENVLKLVKSWMPFEIDSDCFDWKSVVLGHDEVWIQVVAVEKGLLMSLSSAILNNGIKVGLITAIGVLLGEKTAGREGPVILKWKNKESLSVLAVNGLVDLVVSDINEEDLMIYASNKWGLAVNPEEIFLDEDEFNLTKRIFSEKTFGDDRTILNLPILKGIITEKLPEVEGGSEEKILGKEDEPQKKSTIWIYLLILFAALIVAVTVLVVLNFKAV